MGTIAIVGSDSIALSAAQIIKRKGNCKVIVIGRRDEALEMVKNNGAADVVMNNTDDNVTDAICELTDEKGSDIVVEAVCGVADALSLALPIISL